MELGDWQDKHECEARYPFTLHELNVEKMLSKSTQQASPQNTGERKICALHLTRRSEHHLKLVGLTAVTPQIYLSDDALQPTLK